ncbi:hypothetical protein KKF84_11610 [Myxococcota bacterium]|nr:hypothetical protein [Myxococcota bacterium]MBU1535959.1 hypothetical protein [Myxococcota bacterium]
MKEYHLDSLFYLAAAIFLSGCLPRGTGQKEEYSNDEQKLSGNRGGNSRAAGRRLALDAYSKLQRRPKEFTDADLVHLSHRKNLYVLNLSHTAVTDEGLKSFAHSDKLLEIDLSHTAATGESLSYFGNNTQLTSLNLSFIALKDSHLAHLKPFLRLKKLYLQGTTITGEGFSHIVHLPISSLDLRTLPITPEGMASVGQLRNLQFLRLGGTHITDASLGKLAGCSLLAGLNLYDTKVTGSGLSALATLKHLDSVRLPPTFTLQGMRALMKLPHIKNLTLTALPVTITDAWLLAAAGNTYIVTLYLNAKNITDNGFSRISTLTGVRFASIIDGAHLTAGAITQIGRMHSLEGLVLPKFRGHKADWTALVSIKSLKTLAVNHTPIPLWALKILAGHTKMEGLALRISDASQDIRSTLARLSHLNRLEIFHNAKQKGQSARGSQGASRMRERHCIVFPPWIHTLKKRLGKTRLVYNGNFLQSACP